MATRTAHRSYALIAGIAILIMAIVAPVAEIYLYPKLVTPGNAAQTVNNITTQKTLFVSVIFCYLITFVGDIVVAWALYIFLKPVNRNLSLLTAWFRLVFGIIGLVSLLNLVTVFRLLNTSGYTTVFEPAQLYAQVLFCLNTFRSDYHFGLIIFCIHLVLLGYLVFISDYIPRVMGILLVICGIGYLIDTLKPFLFPDFNSGFITITFFGELIFMLWLLIKGARMKELSQKDEI
jgi:Domain of unknown function (DUF4386)